MGPLRNYLIIAIIVLLVASIAAVLAVQGGDNPEVPPEVNVAPTRVSFTTSVEGQNVNLSVSQAEEILIVPTAVPTPQDQGAIAEVTPVATLEPTAAPVPTATTETAAPAPTAVPGLQANKNVAMIIFKQYTVTADDTLYRITTKETTSIELMAQHDIAADHIVANASLNLPVANPDYCPGLRPYVILEGDTVFRIASLNNTDTATLKAINGLGDDFAIKTAEVLCLPS